MIQLVFLLFAFRGDQVGNNRRVGGIVAALLLTTASQDGAILLIVTPCLFFVSFSFLADSLRNRTNIYASKIKNVTNSWNCCATVCANCRKPIQPTPRITVPVPRYKSIMSISFTPFVFLPLSLFPFIFLYYVAIYTVYALLCVDSLPAVVSNLNLYGCRLFVDFFFPGFFARKPGGSTG